MAHAVFVMLLVALCGFEASAAAAGVYSFETYADQACSVLAQTEYVKDVSGSADCYVYTGADGDVADGASSFTLTCNPGPADYAEYESENCTGSGVSSGTDPWFTKTMCTSKGLFRLGLNLDSEDIGTHVEMLVHSAQDTSCLKARVPVQ
ncbi:unnamed protein product [Prorocentrum cordatum]|uniref:Uncharacterized protein n=1 Tax=Prorocentrum cordatum TaxID=2364126 RepID=A0ABN9QDQ0_9DINO|nr:unnamed protein product [Polarella glacialis]